MSDRLSPGTPNTRRANRIDWNRSVTIVKPLRASGRTLNVSAVGLLFSTDHDLRLDLGSEIALDILHLEGKDLIRVRGKVVRLERTHSDLRVAVNLA